jgi:hypothetical protein
MEIFGFSELSTRLFSAILGGLIVFPLMSLSKKIFNKDVAYYAATIFTLSNTYIYYSQETRSYTLVSLLTVLSFLYFFKTFEKPNFKNYLIYTLINTFLLYTHLTPILIYFVQFLGSLLYIKGNLRSVLKLYLSQFVAVALLAIWLLNNEWFGGRETNWAKVPDLSDIPRMLTYYLNHKFVLIIASLLFVWSIIRYKKTNILNAKFITILLWGVIPVLITYLISIYYNPRFVPRYMLYAVPGIYITVAALINKFSNKRYLQWIVIVSISGLMIFKINLKPPKAELWRDAISYYNEYNNKETITGICAVYQYISFAYYYDKDLFEDYKNRLKNLAKNDVYPFNTLPEIQKQLAKGDFSQFILFLSHDQVVDPEAKVLNYFINNYKLKASKEDFQGIRVFVFDLKSKVKTTEVHKEKNKKIVKAKYNTLSKIKLSTFVNSDINQIKFEIDSKKPATGASVVFEVNHNNKHLYWKSIPLTEKGIKHGVRFDSTFKDAELKVYVYQPKTEDNFVIDNFKYSVNANKEFLIKRMRSNKNMMDFIKEKAESKGRTIEEQLEVDANWILNKK